MDNSSTSVENREPAIAYKPRRRNASQAKGQTRQKATPTKRPVKLMIEADAYESLVLHGLRRGESLSDLVTDLVRKHLTDWVIHAKPGPRGAGE